jgi:spore coat polysaccharide biosynthesis protein SpsF
MRHAQVQLALGTVQWGQTYGIANTSGVPDLDEVRSILATARSAGIHVLDTARAYGASESVIGTLVGDDPYWTVITKLSPQIWTPGLSATDVARATDDSLEQSRTALRQRTLAVLLLHEAAHRTVADQAIWKILLEQRREGRIGALGVSAGNPDEAFAALDDPDIEVIQVASSLLDQRLYRSEFFSRAAALGRRVFVRSIFLQGVAHMTEMPEYLAPLRPALTMLEGKARRHGLEKWHLFLEFAKLLTGTTVLLGCETAQQLKANLRQWEGSVDPGTFHLAESIPDLPSSVLDPSKWGL